MSEDSTGKILATGTQDLAALAGLFCTNSVESNALSSHQGYGTVVVSGLSVLGLLGLVKSTIKISLGLERCQAAGFNLESLRGIFGYSSTEKAAGGDKVDCSAISVYFLKDEIVIKKSPRIFDTVRTPMTGIGADWGGLENTTGGLEYLTCVNIGNRRVETSPYHHPVIPFALALLCSGVTAWLIIIVDAPWNWVRVFATAAFHVCILLMLLVPLWLERQMGSPGKHLTPQKWDMLMGNGENQLGVFHILRADVKRGDVIHFQGNTALTGTKTFRVAALLVAALTVVGYISQYATLKSASNNEAIIWISCQAALALLRVTYWMMDPSFDDPDAIHAEYVLLNNTAFSKLPPFQLFCACADGETRLPRWVFDHLTKTDFRDLITTASDTEQDLDIPTEGVEVAALVNIDFNKIIRSRQPDWYAHSWRLCLWRDANHDVHSTILVDISHSVRLDDGTLAEVPSWWMALAKSKIYHVKDDTWSVGDVCTLFAVSTTGERLHLRSNDHEETCDDNCCFGKAETTKFARPDCWRFLWDRGGVNDTLLDKAQSRGEDGFCEVKGLTTWGNAAWVSAREGSVDRRGRYIHGSRGAVLGLRNGAAIPFQEMMGELREYIQEPYRAPKQKKAKVEGALSKA